MFSTRISGLFHFYCFSKIRTFANFTLNKLHAENIEYSRKEARITELETASKSNKDFIALYKASNFPFYAFMKFLEENKPYGLTLLSVDSLDRLVQKEETSGKEETPVEPEVAELEVKADAIKDLAGEKVSIRGYSTNPKDISMFLYNLSKLPCIAKVELKAIEENTMGGERINLFEAILTLGGAV